MHTLPSVKLRCCKQVLHQIDISCDMERRWNGGMKMTNIYSKYIYFHFVLKHTEIMVMTLLMNCYRSGQRILNTRSVVT